jgi:hypothetical protein
VGYHITVEGAFEVVPPADDAARRRVAEDGRGWILSPDGRHLYLPDQDPRAFDALEVVVGTVLPALGLAASGDLEWRGEDGAEGRVSVDADGVHVQWPEEESLPEAEVGRLIEQLASGAKPQRLESTEVLEAFQMCSGPVIDALARALADPDLDVRMRAAAVLTSLGEKAAPATTALVQALDDPEPWMKAAAAEALGAIGPAAAAALPALERLTQHPSYGPSGRAREAIAKIR